MKIKPLSSILVLAFSWLLHSFAPLHTNGVSTDPFIVVLDAGHGGHDPGNLGNGYLEKHIALNIVLKVGELLSKEKDIKVIYTRKDDTFVDLFERGEIANKANADLFVSVHCDSHTSDAQGAGTFVLGLHANKQNFEIAKKENSVIYLEDNYETRYADYDINSPESVIGLTIMQEEFLDQSIALAKMIQDNFSEKLKRNDRKVKQAGFIVLHQTFMPSVLVETGFLTNKDEGAYLNSSKGQVDIGVAIANAILNYKKTTQTNNASSITKKPEEAIADVENSKPLIKEVAAQADVEKAKEPIEKVKNKTVPDTKEVVPVSKKDAQEAEKVASSAVTGTLDGTKKESATSKSNILFKVQLMASGKDLPLTPDNFKGLNLLSKEPYENLFRYMYGETRSHREAEMMKSNAAAKGYATAYIVAYKGGVRIPLRDALLEVSE